MAGKKPPKRDINAFLGPGSELEGRLHFSGSVRLDGRASGHISSHGLLIIGPKANIQADISVDSIIICGEVNGDVTASRFIELRSPAKVSGNLATPSLVIHEGVIFDGACRMTHDEKRQEDRGRLSLLTADKAG